MYSGSSLKDNKASDKNNTDGWAQNIVFLNETKILNRQGKKFKYKNEILKTKRINKRKVAVDIPYNKQGTPVLDEACSMHC